MLSCSCCGRGAFIRARRIKCFLQSHCPLLCLNEASDDDVDLFFFFLTINTYFSFVLITKKSTCTAVLIQRQNLNQLFCLSSLSLHYCVCLLFPIVSGSLCLSVSFRFGKGGGVVRNGGERISGCHFYGYFTLPHVGSEAQWRGFHQQRANHHLPPGCFV